MVAWPQKAEKFIETDCKKGFVTENRQPRPGIWEREGIMRMTRCIAVFCAIAVYVAAHASAGAQTIIEEWAGAKLPPAPVLKPARVDAAKTALLLFDFTTQTCTQERRPRCAARVPKLRQLLDDAHAHNMFVVYSIATADSKPSDILAEIAPRAGDPVLPPLGPDKFIGSDFEKMLKDKGVDTIIITGTAAQTTVLHTGGEAALRGFKVIVPVDSMSSNDAFSELYTAWHLATAARIMTVLILTKVDMISY
jgi:nicotinamidase-related amidase